VPRPNFVQCAERAFRPLVEVSGRLDLAPKLKTKALPPALAPEQFQRFKDLRALDFEPIFLPNGGFLYPYKLGERACLALSSYSGQDKIEQQLASWLDENSATFEPVDPATFLFLAYHAYGYIRLQSEFQTALGAESVIDIIRADYVGHDVFDIIEYYQPIYIITFDETSVFSDIQPYILATELLSMVGDLRSLIVDREFSNAVHQLLQYPSIDAEKLFLTLTSTRWRYAFLELYRCIEAVLFLPWILDLRLALPATCTLRDGYSKIRSTLGWRENKAESIQRLFDKLEGDPALVDAEIGVNQFIDLVNTEDFKRRWVGRRINKIRNMLVHHEDFDDGEVLDVSESEFRHLCLYMTRVIATICARYDEELRA